MKMELKLKNKRDSPINPEGIPTGKKIRPTLEKVKGISQVTRERFYE